MTEVTVSDKPGIARAIEFIGLEIGNHRHAVRVLAERLDVSPQYVRKMLKTGHVPAEQCKPIEAAVRGNVTAAELNPGIFGTPDLRL